MKRHLLLTTYYLLLTTLSVFADNVQFTASAKSPVSVGEQFNLTYSVNANASSFKAPSFKDFLVYKVPASHPAQVCNGLTGR